MSLEYCSSHLRPLEFYCSSPCRVRFCEYCANCHHSHFIRDLVVCPCTIEFNELKKQKERHFDYHVELKAREQEVRSLFGEVDKKVSVAKWKLEEDYKRVVDILKKRFQDCLEEIEEKGKHEKSRICDSIAELDDEIKSSKRKVEIIDYLLEDGFERMMKGLGVMHEDINLERKKQVPFIIQEIQISLLRHPEKLEELMNSF